MGKGGKLADCGVIKAKRAKSFNEERNLRVR